MPSPLFLERDSRGRTTVSKFRTIQRPSFSTSPSLLNSHFHYPQNPHIPYELPLQALRKRMPRYDDDSWYSDSIPFGRLPSHLLNPIGRAMSIDSENRSPRSRHRSLSRYPDRQGPYSHENMDSMAVSPGTRVYPRHNVPSRHYNEPAIPFMAAAQQLDRTIRRAITFFDNFQLTFRECSDGLKFHANKELLNKIWQSQISSSRTSPTHDWTNGKSKRKNNGGTQNDNNGNNGDDYNPNHNSNNYQPHLEGNNNNESRTSSPITEVFSFREYQQQVLSRVEALMHSKDTIIPVAAKFCLPTSSNAEELDDDHDGEVSSARARYHAAATLKRKVRNCYDDLKEAMEAMGKDHVFAKQAIREMKVVKQQLVTYSQAWDEKWEDKGGWDSDEDERDEVGNRNRDGHS